MTEGKVTQVTTATAPPAPTAALSTEQVQAFVAVQSWIEATAQTMDANQEATPPPPPAAVEAPTTAPSLTSVLNAAIASATQVATQNPTATTTNTTDTSIHNTLGRWSLDNVARVQNGSDTLILTQDFGVTPPSAVRFPAGGDCFLQVNSGTFFLN